MIYFVHLQLKRAVEKSLPLEESARWHNRIADFYKARGEDEEFLGRHYALAGKHREGFDYLIAAAEKAERIFAYKQSSDLFKSARRCALELPESSERNKRLFTVNLGAGKALNYISPPDASEYLSRAASLAGEELADKTLASDALIAAGINSLHLGENDTALDLLNSGLSLAVESDDVKLQGEACVGLGFVHDKMGKLDEANNARFNALVQEFLVDSQFIIITHSKRTMTIADVLYGVTMQEPGISKRVSVKFDNQSAAVA